MNQQQKTQRDKYIDKAIMSDGFIRIYSNKTKLNYDIKLLQDKKYKIIEFDGNFISTKMELMFDLEKKLQFPSYFGKNYDALTDCLGDYEIPNNGVVLIFRHLNNLDLEHVHTLLDIFCTYSRQSIVWNRKLITLVQVRDKNFELTQPIGAVNFYLKCRMEK
ncbi:barstar family protein [Microscilla marina]|uniref:Barstar (barnase inhibitor) domain-containing protein n=1 Tax=Microscilla marina ATCC 23134 TaxID=313606 RepID=A1ZY76_MICM2|nr:barstar family protein [Microscilla marina]EAY24642.1 hypothetical protein M23134_00594 [Microscilla marina ATCC 23134]